MNIWSITKYKKQQQIIQYTERDHSDYNNLTKANTSIQQIIEFVNSQIARVENIEKLSSIQKKYFNELQIDIVDDFRLFLKEGNANYIDNNLEKKKCRLLLFSDQIIIFSHIENFTSVLFHSHLIILIINNDNSSDDLSIEFKVCFYYLLLLLLLLLLLFKYLYKIIVYYFIIYLSLLIFYYFNFIYFD